METVLGLPASKKALKAVLAYSKIIASLARLVLALAALVWALR
jgi:hypothetical protein